jgi:hypothetical protein
VDIIAEIFMVMVCKLNGRGDLGCGLVWKASMFELIDDDVHDAAGLDVPFIPLSPGSHPSVFP